MDVELLRRVDLDAAGASRADVSAFGAKTMSINLSSSSRIDVDVFGNAGSSYCRSASGPYFKTIILDTLHNKVACPRSLYLRQVRHRYANYHTLFRVVSFLWFQVEDAVTYFGFDQRKNVIVGFDFETD